MTALKQPIAAALRRCVLILPGVTNPVWDAPLAAEDGEILVTRSVSEALAFAPDQWGLVVSGPWEPAEDEEFEIARIRDLSRALAAAADGYVAPVLIDDNRMAVSSAGSGAMFEEAATNRIDADALPGALSMYATGRPVKGAKAMFAFSLLQYGAGVVISGADHVRLDLTGRARPLIGGPYLCLSAGRWRVNLTFSVSDLLANRTLRFEWGPMSGGVAQEFAFDKAGRYELDLDADWDKADFCEIRVALPTGAFAGLFDLEACAIQRL